MKKYSKPAITKVTLYAKEHVLNFCKTGSQSDYGKCYYCSTSTLDEVYG